MSYYELVFYENIMQNFLAKICAKFSWEDQVVPSSIFYFKNNSTLAVLT